MKSVLSKLESFSCVDGPGRRAVVFTQGCPWRCGYCHNPETQDAAFCEDVPPQALAARLARFAPYLTGVTYSGGEPLLHAAYLSKVTDLLSGQKLDFAVETAGGRLSEEILAFLRRMDLVLLDVKAVDDDSYRKLTGGLTLSAVADFLRAVTELNKRVWVRQVIVPGYNDTEENVKKLGEIVRPFHPERVQLLPFRKLCEGKYEELGRAFPFADFCEMPERRILELEKYLDVGEA